MHGTLYLIILFIVDSEGKISYFPIDIYIYSLKDTTTYRFIASTLTINRFNSILLVENLLSCFTLYSMPLTFPRSTCWWRNVHVVLFWHLAWLQITWFVSTHNSFWSFNDLDDVFLENILIHLLASCYCLSYVEPSVDCIND